MTLRLYNTLSRSLTDFKPIKDGEASLYVCGPTVYDHAHIGHARAAVAFDILVRHLRALGYRVNYVRNYTDVDDKIINKANSSGLNWKDLADNFIQSFSDDMDALNCLVPTHSPRATEYIQEMLEDVEAILARGFAYIRDGDVYFDVDSFKAYGRLSRREILEAEPGARVMVDDRKKNPADFALWKSAKPEEPAWPSPWGPGRPGWHIECSTMSARLLGAAFDIHGGGQDLIFPHHENELAQSMALDRPMATIWTHNGFVNINNEKMSKSLGNSFNIKDIFQHYPPEVLRFFLLSSHYRGPIDFSEDGLKESGKALERIYRAINSATLFLKTQPEKDNNFQELSINTDSPTPVELLSQNSQEAKELQRLFTEALNDDLNTSQALGYLFEVVRQINKLVTENEPAGVLSFLEILYSLGDELGLAFREPCRFIDRWDALKLDKVSAALTPKLIEEMVAQRNLARQNKDWAEADRLRQELLEKGVVLEDRGGKTTWRLA
ncbi:MAG: cysteine--tRNA ligase [Deltaproteobacteria bacterium]|jgi:cysteinyl-tRNA synthetase|nr:cysteine--tRNA ligase [Deltaproteobacteria bacterium]